MKRFQAIFAFTFSWFLTVFAHAETSLNQIDNTISPDNKYAIAWSAPERESFPLAETYVIDANSGAKITPLPSKLHWVTEEQLENHETVTVSWSGDSNAFILIVDGKWTSKSVDLYGLDGDQVITSPNFFKFVQEAVEGAFFHDKPAVKHENYVLSASGSKPAPNGNLVLTAVLQVPWGEHPVFIYSVEIELERYKSWMNPKTINVKIVSEE